MFQFLKWVCMWWDATLRSVSIEWRGHSAQQDDWGSVFWCKKKHYYSMFFASLWACGGWYLAFCQQLEEGHMRVGVGGDAPLCGGVPGVYFRPTAHLSTKQRMQWLGCFFVCAYMNRWRYRNKFKKIWIFFCYHDMFRESLQNRKSDTVYIYHGLVFNIFIECNYSCSLLLNWLTKIWFFFSSKMAIYIKKSYMVYGKAEFHLNSVWTEYAALAQLFVVGPHS